ncbi:MAG TPA: ATP-dependent DNA ligase [Clostridiaceae bacterium]|jgi:DNA ligase D-like protein (predicted ligase)|nr:ATP-dependent DNA ligase [Clostridiaceae bacterium]
MMSNDLFAKKNLKPMLALRHDPFDSEDYMYEIKWDGIRCLAYIDEKTVLKSRNNRDITFEYPEFEGLSGLVNNHPVILDGEIVVMKNGMPSFHEWQKRSSIKDRNKLIRIAQTNPATYVVFDIVYSKGRELLSIPLKERKDILQDTVINSKTMVVSDYIFDKGIEFYNAAVSRGLEGVVAKKTDSPYVPGKRTNYWLKFKKVIEEDFVACGYLRGKMWGLGSLILGLYDDNEKLVYQGTVGTGFSREDCEMLVEHFNLTHGEYPFENNIKEISSGIFGAAYLVCTVEFLEKGESGLRHASFKGVRSDKDPRECIIRRDENG